MPSILLPEDGLRNVKAIVFDMYGTLVDVSEVAQACQKIAPDPQAFAATWRHKQLEYSFLSTALGRYRTFWELSKRALDYAAAEAGIEVSIAQKKVLMDAWLRPVPYADTETALEKLSARYRLAILSNGNPRMLREGLKHTHLAGYFDSVISADAVQMFKPAPDVYRLAVDQLKIDTSAILFVSSNGFDVVGARHFGFRVCWVNRRSSPMDALGFPPTIRAGTLTELADHLIP